LTTAIIGVGNLGSALGPAAGFDPVKAGGVDAAPRIEMPGGDLHQMGPNGELLDLDRAREVLATTEVTA
jgi:hypothetical protein